MIVVDTCVLGRLPLAHDAQRQVALKAIFTLRRSDELVVAPQVLYEFWAVCTKALHKNGLGMARDRALRWHHRMRRMLRVIDEPPHLLETWLELVHAHNVQGVDTHDARLAALVMVAHANGLLTFNGRHFRGFLIKVIDPAAV